MDGGGLFPVASSEAASGSGEKQKQAWQSLTSFSFAPCTGPATATTAAREFQLRRHLREVSDESDASGSSSSTDDSDSDGDGDGDGERPATAASADPYTRRDSSNEKKEWERKRKHQRELQDEKEKKITRKRKRKKRKKKKKDSDKEKKEKRRKKTDAEKIADQEQLAGQLLKDRRGGGNRKDIWATEGRNGGDAYYVDTKPDRDNLAYGGLYSGDIAKFQLYAPR